MSVPASVKPAVWGAIGGAIAAIIVGFAWGGWVTGGTAAKMETASAEAAVIQAFAKAEQQPDKLVPLREESSYQRDDFVVEAGWVDNVSEEYRTEVATACAETLVEGMAAEPTASLLADTPGCRLYTAQPLQISN